MGADEGGGKAVHALPSLKCIKKLKQVSTLPPESVAFLGSGTCVSGSGDNSVHLLNFRRGSGGGTGSCCWCLFLTVYFLILVFMLLRIGLKGAALGQGSAEF